MPRPKAKPYKERVALRSQSRKELQWYETPKFMKLAKKWHDKLEKSGFSDAEEFDSPLQLMKSHHNDHFRQKAESNKFEDRQRYFELASQLLHTYKFDSKLDKDIWYQHSEGASERKTAEILGCSYEYVRKVVKRIKPAIKRDARDILEDLKRLKGDDED